MFILTAITLGFFGSFHCVGMCGPIALALPLGNKPAMLKAVLTLLYNAGRATTYAVIGLLSGTIGKGFFLAGWQQAVSIALGLLLLVAVFIPSRNGIRHHWNGRAFRFFNTVKQSLAMLLTRGRQGSLFIIGLLNGLLPCGLVYIAVSGAMATGDPLKGALFMALFGFGTVPLMFALPVAAQLAGSTIRPALRKTMPVLTCIVAVLLILRGLNLGIPYISPQFNKTTGNPAACHKTTPACCHKMQNL